MEGRRTTLKRMAGTLLTVGGVSLPAVAQSPAHSRAPAVDGSVATFGIIPDTVPSIRAWGTMVEHLATTGEAISLPPGTYRLTGLTLPLRGGLQADPGAVIARSTPGGPMLTVSDDPRGAQSDKLLRLDGLTLDARIGQARNGTGLLIGNNAATVLDRLCVRGAAIGLHIDRGQFLSIANARFHDNDVGVYCRPSKREGGANSLTFLHPIFTSNAVGMVLNNADNTYGQGDVLLINPQFLSNSVCALAVIGLNARERTQVWITGMAPEGNGQALPGAPANHTFEGQVIPRCSIYALNAKVCIDNGGIAEYGPTNPCIILRSSTLVLHNVEGYGGPTGTSVDADAGSDVIISGLFGVIGACHGVSSFSGHLDQGASQGALVGPVRRRLDDTVPNLLADPEIGAFQPTPGVRDHSIVQDTHGRSRRVVFAQRPGSSEANSTRLAIGKEKAERICLRLEIRSDRDTRLRIATYPNDGAITIHLPANRPVLVCYWVNDAANPAGLLALSPADADGPTLLLRRVQVVKGALSDPDFRRHCDTLLSGGYNPHG